MLRRLVFPLFAVALFLSALPAFAQDAADIVVRLNRLESQVRQMSGQIEELQHQNGQLREQLRKFQEDVEFRFQEGKGGAPRPSAAPSATPSQSPPAQPRPGRRSDAFDPGTTPGAPGAPQHLGTTAPSAPLQLPSGALTSGSGPMDDDAPPPGGGAPLDLGQLGQAGPALPPRAGGPSVAATGSADPRTDYDAAYAYLLQKQYEQAEMGFRQFLQSHPRDRLVPDATFWLGETYLQRNRHREAAEQFLKISTQFPGSAKAPDAMLKLGIALNALGAREQACATFAELEHKYPQAGARQAAEREQRRARCAA